MIVIEDHGEYWEIRLEEPDQPAHIIRGSHATCLQMRAAILARIAADKAIDPTEREHRSWLRSLDHPEETLPAQAMPLGTRGPR
jgi:hypothetical protein